MGSASRVTSSRTQLQRFTSLSLSLSLLPPSGISDIFNAPPLGLALQLLMELAEGANGQHNEAVWNHTTTYPKHEWYKDLCSVCGNVHCTSSIVTGLHLRDQHGLKVMWECTCEGYMFQTARLSFACSIVYMQSRPCPCQGHGCNSRFSRLSKSCQECPPYFNCPSSSSAQNRRMMSSWRTAQQIHK